MALIVKARRPKPADAARAAVTEQPDRAPPGTRRATSSLLELASPSKADAAAAQAGRLPKAASDSLADRLGDRPAPLTLLPGYASRPNSSPQRLSPPHSSAQPDDAGLGPEPGLKPRPAQRRLPFGDATSSGEPSAGLQLGRAPSDQTVDADRKGSGSAVAQVELWNAREPAADASAAGEGPAAALSPAARAQRDVLAELTSELAQAPVSQAATEVDLPAPAAEEQPAEPAADAGPRPKPRKRARSTFQVRCQPAACRGSPAVQASRRPATCCAEQRVSPAMWHRLCRQPHPRTRLRCRAQAQWQ